MITLAPLHPTQYRELYEVSQITNTWFRPDFTQFASYLSTAKGWAICNKGKIIGFFIYTNISTSADAHVSVLPEYQKKWLTRTIYKTIFNYPFEVLKVNRINGFVVDGTAGDSFPPKLGFIKEGIIRNGFVLPSGKLANITVWGLLPDERRWK